MLVLFYTMIFDKDPTQLRYDEPALDNGVETLIRQVVKAVVFDQRQRWNFTEQSIHRVTGKSK